MVIEGILPVVGLEGALKEGPGIETGRDRGIADDLCIPACRLRTHILRVCVTRSGP